MRFLLERLKKLIFICKLHSCQLGKVDLSIMHTSSQVEVSNQIQYLTSS